MRWSVTTACAGYARHNCCVDVPGCDTSLSCAATQPCRAVKTLMSLVASSDYQLAQVVAIDEVRQSL